MLYYGIGIQIFITAMFIISIRMLKRSVLFGILFSGFFIILFLYHGGNLMSALNQSRPAASYGIANSK